MSGERVSVVVKMAQQPISLSPAGDSDDRSLGDYIEDENAGNPREIAAIVLLRQLIRAVLGTLSLIN